MLSEYQLKIADIFQIVILKNQCLTFLIKKDVYVPHYENLQLYLRLVLKELHRVLEFHQSPWLKPYIEFNAQKKNRNRKNENKDGKPLHK